MFRRNKQTAPREISSEEKTAIVIAYFERIAPSYKDQELTAETMIQMELSLLTTGAAHG